MSDLAARLGGSWAPALGEAQIGLDDFQQQVRSQLSALFAEDSNSEVFRTADDMLIYSMFTSQKVSQTDSASAEESLQALQREVCSPGGACVFEGSSKDEQYSELYYEAYRSWYAKIAQIGSSTVLQTSEYSSRPGYQSLLIHAERGDRLLATREGDPKLQLFNFFQYWTHDILGKQLRWSRVLIVPGLVESSVLFLRKQKVETGVFWDSVKKEPLERQNAIVNELFFNVREVDYQHSYQDKRVTTLSRMFVKPLPHSGYGYFKTKFSDYASCDISQGDELNFDSFYKLAWLLESNYLAANGPAKYSSGDIPNASEVHVDFNRLANDYVKYFANEVHKPCEFILFYPVTVTEYLQGYFLERHGIEAFSLLKVAWIEVKTPNIRDEASLHYFGFKRFNFQDNQLLKKDNWEGLKSLQVSIWIQISPIIQYSKKREICNA